jgi:hypothetical protein
MISKEKEGWGRLGVNGIGIVRGVDVGMSVMRLVRLSLISSPLLLLGEV